mgnify:CR=1 FL=1
MNKLSLFGERSLTLVAATFPTRAAAVDAATTLQAELPQAGVDLIHPHDVNLARKLEPESQGIWRTAIRSHLVLGLAGLVLGAGLLLAGCSSVGVGVGIPVGPVTIGVGASNNGVSLGVGTGVGPVGVGVGVNQRGQVSAGAGVGVSAPVGDSKARVGVGVGTSTVIHDPDKPSR